MKPKTQSKAMQKGKKQPEIVEIKKINRQIDEKESINFFIRKPSQFFQSEKQECKLTGKNHKRQRGIQLAEIGKQKTQCEIKGINEYSLHSIQGNRERNQTIKQEIGQST